MMIPYFLSTLCSFGLMLFALPYMLFSRLGKLPCNHEAFELMWWLNRLIDAYHATIATVVICLYFEMS
jgi:hypothetical protein